MYVLETPKLQDFKSASKNEHYCQIASRAFLHVKPLKMFRQTKLIATKLIVDQCKRKPKF